MSNKINPIFIPPYKLIPVKTSYIKPGESLDIIINNAGPYLENGDFLVISETPVSISQERLVDESLFKPSLIAIFLSDVWSKYIWGYLLGPILRIKPRTIKNLRKLPPEARAHKEVVLKYYGIKHALKPASEAGIDLSNVPGNFVSLLPEKSSQVARKISEKIEKHWEKEVIVLIIDTDATYKLGNFRFTCLPAAIEGIKSNLGIIGYLLGRMSKTKSPTPLGSSFPLKIEHALEMAELAEKYQKSQKNNLETVYKMQESFNKDTNEITVDMLNSVVHTPAVIIKRID
ncbi:MAG: coenzyme F420-0:L-glutamate ligase [Euryarchaeota archaeon]|nr:coenzyme F420-0:L-glutamate ligase [Euryarchaeota archaeon]MBU4547714.1 coenzyme F420-0:L-glutamate ligase [Euryarchaeota archaeon]MBU4607903.1 coenzyme F420-0:L-glutamate ligase [Euryarchaeota archaeon]MBV1754425.1 coenzyme F420-0:L-glutamate ligase [Methanobacterium sp.]MBV1767029.1 coenzyme F420-0:L-glutamate ligase [Methanobacterium sp.]